MIYFVLKIGDGMDSKNKLNRNEIILLIIEGIKICVSSFSGPFLVAFFISLTLSNIASYSIYKIVTNIIALIFSFIISRFIKKKNKIVSFRFGILINIFYLLSLIFFKESIIDNSWLLGVFLGLSNAFYYMPFNYIVSNEVRGEVLTKWTSYKSNITSAINILLPLMLGILLTYFNYYDIAIIFVIIQFVSFIISFLYKGKEKQLPTFSIRKYLSAIKKAEAYSRFKIHYAIEFLNGFTFSSSALESAITIFVMLSFKTNLNLGIFTSVFTIINFITALNLSRIKNKDVFPKIMLVSVVLIVSSIIYFILSTSTYSLITYNLTYNIAYVVISIITYVSTFSTVNSVKEIKKAYQLEHFSVREFFLCLGRIISFSFLFIISLLNNILYYKLLIGVYTLSIITMNYLVYKLYKK